MDKFVSIKKLDSQLQPDQTLIKADDYRQLINYESLLNQVEERERSLNMRAESVLQEAVQKGLEQGMEQASQKLSEELFGFTLRMHENLRNVEQSLVEVMIDAVGRIIQGFDDETLVKNSLRNGLELIRGGNKLTVRAHPQMLEAVNEQMQEVQQSFSHIEVIADNHLKVDECTLESDVGIVNASVELQVEALVQAIRKSFPAPVA